MHYIQPKKSAAKEKIRHFLPAIIENRCIPMRMNSFAHVLMFIQGRSVEQVEAKIVGWEMRWHPIENDTDVCLMQNIDKHLKIGRRAIPTSDRVKSAHLIAPRLIERMFHHGHELYMGESHLLAIASKFFR